MKRPVLSIIMAHIFGWLVFQSLPLAFLLAQSDRHLGEVLGSFAYWQFFLYYIIAFYLHEYVLLPFLFFKKKMVLYILTILLLLVSAFYIQPFGRMSASFRPPHENRFPPQSMQQMPEEFRRPPPNLGPRMGRGMRPGFVRVDIIGIVLLAMTVMFGASLAIARKWRLTEQKAAQAEADKANAELSVLKAQINPHFLFNTLNNIYSMAVTRNEHTADMLLKLSNIMRYVTDDVNENYVSLQHEVECISDYVDLQQVRLGKKVQLEYQVTGDLSDKKIAPLILLSFIENLFKYGVSNHEPSPLTIHISAEVDGIRFFARNRLFTAARPSEERTGIGISNTQKRLEHLYRDAHELLITRENGFFTVELFLKTDSIFPQTA